MLEGSLLGKFLTEQKVIKERLTYNEMVGGKLLVPDSQLTQNNTGKEFSMQMQIQQKSISEDNFYFPNYGISVSQVIVVLFRN